MNPYCYDSNDWPQPAVDVALDGRSLAETIGFELLGRGLAEDVKSSIHTSLLAGAVLVDQSDPLVVYRQALAASIRNIETHPRGILFQQFLLKGPYEDNDEIPAELADQRLTDKESAKVVNFIYSHMVNCFKGAITELLAIKPCLLLKSRLQQVGRLPPNTQIFVGDSVRIRGLKGKALLKAADMHLLIRQQSPDGTANVSVMGVVEVKSSRLSEKRLRRQLDQHVHRLEHGLNIFGVDYPPEDVTVGFGQDRQVISVDVRPSDWKLPRTFRYEDSEPGRILHIDSAEPPLLDDVCEQIAADHWRITLRWSTEALAEAAYEMTFWYMEKIGEVIYSKYVPKGWEGMSPAEAGRNAAKMMLYYAIRRCRTINTIREKQRAIALYNSYGYGYALGMNFKNTEGKREMLWPQDLDEIHNEGRTKEGCTID